MRHALIVLVMMFLVAPALLEAQRKQEKTRDTGSTKAQAGKDTVQEKSNSKLDLSGLSEQLKKLVESGKLTEEEARKLVDLVGKPQPKGKPGAGGKSVDLEALGKRLKAAVAAGTMTEGEAIAEYKKASAGQPGAANKTADRSDRDWDKAYEQLLKNSPGLRQKVASGGATREQVIAWMKQREGGDKGKGGKGKGGKGAGAKEKGGEKSAGGANFYAIVIGRLKTKDIELGEFTMEVDHVTSMYGSRWVKDEIVGQEVAVTGVSIPEAKQSLDGPELVERIQVNQFTNGLFVIEIIGLDFSHHQHVGASRIDVHGMNCQDIFSLDQLVPVI